MPTYKEWLQETLASVAFRGTWGQRLLDVLGTQADRITDAAKESVKAGFPDVSPDDALAYNGPARNIERYTADTATTYRARIVGAWTQWALAGTDQALIKRLADQGYSAVRVLPWRTLTPDVPDRWRDHWSAFWLWIDQPNTIGNDGVWDGPGKWDDLSTSIDPTTGLPVSGYGVWDCDLVLSRVNELRASIRKWKAGHEVCAGIRVISTAEVWDSVSPWDSGTWDSEAVASIILEG